MEERTIEFEANGISGGCTLTLTGPGLNTILFYSWDEDGTVWKEAMPAEDVRDWLNKNLPS